MNTTPFELSADEGYKLYRGRCRELSEAACAADPSLKLVRGHYFCPFWSRDEAHWWTERVDGTIFDPTKDQFPSKGSGIYTPFSGFIDCSECGKTVKEEDANLDSNYAFCSYTCHGRFIGLL